MFVIRLANGNLLVPESALSDTGRVIGDAYVEIGPTDADYSRLATQAVTEEEHDERRRRWQAGDEQLRQEFLDYLARHGSSGGWNDDPESRG
jgi:post-segregation antitoxin (ccd killing protein)